MSFQTFETRMKIFFMKPERFLFIH